MLHNPGYIVILFTNIHVSNIYLNHTDLFKLPDKTDKTSIWHIFAQHCSPARCSKFPAKTHAHTEVTEP